MTLRDDQIDRRLAAVGDTATKVAVYAGRAGTSALVDIGDRRVALPFRAFQLPPPGHPVQVETSNGQTYVTGPSRPLPTSGTVIGVGPLLDIMAWGGQGDRTRYQLEFDPSYNPLGGDVVEIKWTTNGGYVAGRIPFPPHAEPAPPPRAVAPDTFHPDPFTAVWSRSTGAGVSQDVRATPASTGGWGYGSKIVDTIPTNAVILSASIYLPARRVGGDPPLLRTHRSSDTPTAPLQFSGTAFPLTDTRVGWVPIPLPMIDFLKLNSGGLGFDHGGDNIYRGVQGDQYSGALDITWSA